LNLLKSTLPHSETSVQVAYNKSNAFFTFENTRLTCRLIDAQYPDYNAVIPVNNPNKLTLDRLEFQNALRRISIYSNKTTYQVILSISGSELKISAQDLDFSNEATEKLACSYEGNDMDIAFNARFLIEMLGVLSTKEIEIELINPNTSRGYSPGRQRRKRRLVDVDYAGNDKRRIILTMIRQLSKLTSIGAVTSIWFFKVVVIFVSVKKTNT
jgi:DNA polymerase III sliding clamp (beta) subunit (PCNA family)